MLPEPQRLLILQNLPERIGLKSQQDLTAQLRLALKIW